VPSLPRAWVSGFFNPWRCGIIVFYGGIAPFGYGRNFIIGGFVLNNFLETVIQKASWKKAVLFSALFAASYVLINYSGIGVAGLLKITGGANILDFEFGYSYEKAYNMLTALGVEGRTFYLTKILPMDYPFPLTYMLFYIGFIALLIKHTAKNKPYRFLLFIPVLAMLFDWIENIGLITMLSSYPNLLEWAVPVASIFGMLKTIFMVGSIMIIGVLLVMFVYSKIRKE